MKKTVLFLLFLVFVFALVACGGKEIPGGDEGPGDQIPTEEYDVVFNSNGGTAVQKKTVEAGTSLAEPTRPTKTDCVFLGWYYDQNLTEKVVWPIKVDSNLTLYAGWKENRVYFLEARDATVNSDQFEYNFNLNVTTNYGSIAGPSANIVGNVKYNSAAQTSYLKSETCSGLLLLDGKKYTVKIDDQLAIFQLNENDILKKFYTEKVSEDFKFESSSYAKVLFEFPEQQINTVTLSQNGKYEVKFSGSLTSYINSALQLLNHPIIANFIDLPNNDSSLKVYVTYENDKIKTFAYDFSISVTDFSINFHYDLTFTKIGTGVTITAPKFEGISITDDQISAELGDIKTLLGSYRGSDRSGYDYNVKTEVDYPGANAINATAKGRTMRVIQGEDVFFWNRIEFDSDYKNADLYKDLGIVDYERYRVVYANKDVYDVIDRAWPLSNIYNKIENYQNHSLDEFYLLLPDHIFTLENIVTAQKITSGNKVTYHLGLSNEGVLNIFEFVDDSIRVDVNEQNEIVIYNVESGLEISDVEFYLEFVNGELSKITIKLTGKYEGSYENTDFSGLLDFKLDYSLTTNDQADSYVIPAEDDDVVLVN